MQFLFLLHADEAAEAALTADERRALVEQHIAYNAGLRERGALVHGAPLDGNGGTRVVRDGTVTSGPYDGAQIGGYYVVECPDLDAALALAAEVPPSPGLAVEVRTVAVMD